MNSIGDTLAVAIMISCRNTHLCHLQSVDAVLLGTMKLIANVENVKPHDYNEQVNFIDRIALRMKALVAQADQLNSNRSVS